MYLGLCIFESGKFWKDNERSSLVQLNCYLSLGGQSSREERDCMDVEVALRVSAASAGARRFLELGGGGF